MRIGATCKKLSHLEQEHMLKIFQTWRKKEVRGKSTGTYWIDRIWATGARRRSGSDGLHRRREEGGRRDRGGGARRGRAAAELRAGGGDGRRPEEAAGAGRGAVANGPAAGTRTAATCRHGIGRGAAADVSGAGGRVRQRGEEFLGFDLRENPRGFTYL